MAKSLVLNRNRKVPAEDTAAFGAIAERFRRAGALERAVELCREGLQKFPDHISARVTLGWSLLDLGKYDDARVELEQVLRRAPDNLAAIRGLAELHDRFEHTLNLPMDGPGQWPPPAESVDDTQSTAFAAVAAEADLEMTPPEMGMPIWSPATSAAPTEEPPSAEATRVAPPTEAEKPKAAKSKKAKAAKAAPVTPEPPTPAVAAPPVQQEPAAPAAAAVSVAPAAAAAAAEPVAPAAPIAAAAVTAPPISTAAVVSPAPASPAASAASASGMSSVREIDFSGAQVAVPESSGEVSDEDIQALIAEAESLDAAAGFSAMETETVSLDPMALGIQDPLQAAAEVVETAGAAYTDEISVDLDLSAGSAEIDDDTAALAQTSSHEIEQIEQPVVVAHTTMEAPVEAPAAWAEPAERAEHDHAVFAEAPPAGELAAVEPAIAEPIALEEPAVEASAAEPVAAFEATVIETPVETPAVIAVAPEPMQASEVAEVTEAPASVAEVLRDEFATLPAAVAQVSVDEPVVAVAAEAAQFDVADIVETAAVAGVAEIISIESARSSPRSPVPALERLLAKVQARRAQLMAESVA